MAHLWVYRKTTLFVRLLVGLSEERCRHKKNHTPKEWNCNQNRFCYNANETHQGSIGLAFNCLHLGFGFFPDNAFGGAFDLCRPKCFTLAVFEMLDTPKIESKDT
uniref:Uncharacterized protein n=1 Tax=Spongospora subterranea TaxID=70186 RepID=A0A0H5REM2_9EUKA|eukprot:CRZ12473.1 hypothetical protein [Spongospora subterranea]